MTAKSNTSQPFQAIERAPGGELRFRPNAIVQALLDHGERTGLDLNKIAVMPFERVDRVQLAQLIGYTLNGFAELGYVTDEDMERANSMARESLHPRPTADTTIPKLCSLCGAHPRIRVDLTPREISVTIHCFSLPPCQATMVEARSRIGCNTVDHLISEAVTHWNAEVDQRRNTNGAK